MSVTASLCVNNYAVMASGTLICSMCQNVHRRPADLTKHYFHLKYRFLFIYIVKCLLNSVRTVYANKIMQIR